MVQTDSSSMLNVCPFFKFNNELIQIFKYTYKYNTYTFKIFFYYLKSIQWQCTLIFLNYKPSHVFTVNC